jgi:hypothetical protein
MRLTECQTSIPRRCLHQQNEDWHPGERHRKKDSLGV